MTMGRDEINGVVGREEGEDGGTEEFGVGAVSREVLEDGEVGHGGEELEDGGRVGDGLGF